MALHLVNPEATASDLITFKEAVALLADTPHPVSESTLKRWWRRSARRKVRIGGVDRISFTDVLEVHRDEVNKRQARQF